MNSVVERLGWVLVHSLWQFVGIALVAGAVASALKTKSATLRYGVLVVALGGMLAASSVTWWGLPSGRLNGAAGDSPNRVTATRATRAPEPDTQTADLSSEIAVGSSQANRGMPQSSEATLPTPPAVNRDQAVGAALPRAETTWAERVRPWLGGVVAVWSFGVVVGSLRPLVGWWTLLRLRRSGVSAVADGVLAAMSRVAKRLKLRRAVRVLQSTLAPTPVVVGYFQPVILLPVSLVTAIPVVQLEAILTHELAHVQRHDFVVNLLQTLIETLFFYHPAVWWLSRRIRVEREHCCDDLVVRTLGNRVEYGRALVAVEELRGRSSLLALGVADGSLLARVRRIVGAEGAVSTPRSPWAAFTIALLIGVGVTLTSLSAPPRSKPAVVESALLDAAAPDQPKAQGVAAAEWPMWGGSPLRNHVASGRLPVDWDLTSGRNIAWKSTLGTATYSSPVVSGGKVFIGTNNEAGLDPRWPKEQDFACLVCFDQVTGQRLWQYFSAKMPVGRRHDWPSIGLCSTSCVVGDRVYCVTNRGEVVCLDTNGFRDGENDGPFVDEPERTEVDADLVWKFDMFTLLKVRPLHQTVSSIAVVDGIVLLNTSNAPDETQHNVPEPQAPHFLALDAQTGQVIWQDNSSGESILVGGSPCGCSGTSPAVATIGGVKQAIFAGREGWLYAFDFADLKKGKTTRLWQFDCNPKTSFYTLGSKSTRNTLVASPVVVGNRVYIATGRNPEMGEGTADLWCIDATKRGDLSTKLVFNRSYRNGDEPIPHKPLLACDSKAGDFTRPNPNSGALWHYAGVDRNGNGKLDFEESFHRAIGNPAIHDGLLFIADFSGLVHCVDAETGKGLWTYDLLAACWSSCVVVDGHVVIGDEDGDVAILKASRQCEPIGGGSLNLGQPIYATPAFVSDTLLMATPSRLVAIRQ